jgi:hypothetical protein
MPVCRGCHDQFYGTGLTQTNELRRLRGWRVTDSDPLAPPRENEELLQALYTAACRLRQAARWADKSDRGMVEGWAKEAFHASGRT